MIFSPIDLLVTVFNGIRQQKITAGGIVAIQGLGGLGSCFTIFSCALILTASYLGHLAVQYARKMGYTVVAISTSEDKRDFATKLGAHHYINAKKEKPAEALQKLGGADLIVATAPTPDAISPLVDGCAPLGKLLILSRTFLVICLGDVLTHHASAVGEMPINTVSLIMKVSRWSRRRKKLMC